MIIYDISLNSKYYMTNSEFKWNIQKRHRNIYSEEGVRYKKNTNLTQQEVREYRSWKHSRNRKNQYK
jgi:hypothetical protein